MPYLHDFTAILVFALHLLAMNIASAAPLASVWFDWRGVDRPVSHAAARYLSGSALISYFMGMLQGLALMGLAWNAEQTKAIFTLLESKIGYGVIELGFSLVLMLAHYVWLRNAGETSSRAGRMGRTFLVLLATSNLLYHFPPLFAVAAKIAAGWRPAVDHITPTLFREQLLSPAVASQSVHFVLAALAAAGMVVLIFSLRLHRRGATAEEIARVTKLGARMALVPTLLQILVGMWVLLSLPTTDQQRLMGGDMLPTGMFLFAMATTLGLMHKLASISMGDGEPRNIRRAIAAFGITVLLMTAVLYNV